MDLTHSTILLASALLLGNGMQPARNVPTDGQVPGHAAGAVHPGQYELQIGNAHRQSVAVLPMLELDFFPAPIPPGVASPAALGAAAQPAQPEVEGQAAAHVTMTSDLRARRDGPSASRESRGAPNAKPQSSANEPNRAPERFLPLGRIPRSPDARRELARQMLAEARRLLNQNQLDQAETLAYQLRELAVEYSRWEDSPRHLLRDIDEQRGRQPTSTLFPTDLARF